jgi:putative transposase
MENRERKTAGSGPPKNVGLLQFIRAKRERDWRPSPEELRQGFRGWHQRGYLPHFDAPGVTQMVTVMLGDSFPVTRCPEWEPILHEPDQSEKRRKLEAWLDRGHGTCWLRRPEVAQVVEAELLDHDGKDCELQAWVIMPNHVHLVVDIWDMPLSRLMHLWKGKSSRRSNAVLGRRGCFWQEDYFDTLLRDSEHLAKAVRYTEQNPTKARVVADPADWLWSSARWRDQFGRISHQPGRETDPGL